MEEKITYLIGSLKIVIKKFFYVKSQTLCYNKNL